MDVWSLDLNDSQGHIRDKGEFMLGLCEQCYGDKSEQPAQIHH